MQQDWIEVELGDIGDIFSGGTPKTSISEYWGDDIPWISPSDLSNYNKKYISKGKKSITKLGLAKSSATLLPKGTVLFSSRAPIGYTVIASNILSTNQGFKSIFLKNLINNEYIYYYLKFSKSRIEAVATGTTFKEISKSVFSKLEIPLPSLPIQRAIVAKIEGLFSSLDKAIADLRLAQNQLKIYRQAVLKKAFENYDFTTKELQSLIEVKDGTHDTPKYIEDGIPFITQKNIRDEGLIFHNAKNISVEDHEKFYKRSNVSKGDILISMIGANRGMVCVVNTDIVFSIKNVGLLKHKPDTIDNKYLLFYLKSDYAKEFIKQKSKGGAQEFIGLTELRKFPIKYIDIDIQKKIVKEIESRLSVCDKVEQSIKDSLAQAEALRQSILKKAFSGELLTAHEVERCRQQPDYEPAEKLLARIKESNSKKQAKAKK